jgi:hypothetical protein
VSDPRVLQLDKKVFGPNDLMKRSLIEAEHQIQQRDRIADVRVRQDTPKRHGRSVGQTGSGRIIDDSPNPGSLTFGSLPVGKHRPHRNLSIGAVGQLSGWKHPLSDQPVHILTRDPQQFARLGGADFDFFADYRDCVSVIERLRGRYEHFNKWPGKFDVDVPHLHTKAGPGVADQCSNSTYL